MIQNVTLGRPYAKAIFEYALENDTLEKWKDFLRFAAAFVTFPQAREILQDPRLTVQQGSDFVQSACAKLLFPEAKSLLDLLSANRKLVIISAVSDVFCQYELEHNKTINVMITTAFKLSSEWQDKLKNIMQSKLNKQILMSIQEDPTLLGGVIVQYGDDVIDGSVRGHINRLQSELLS